jgi:hypothetical protein
MHFHVHRSGTGGPAAETGPSLPPVSETSDELRVLQPSQVRLRRRDGRLEMREKTYAEWREVNLVRLFPHSEPEGWTSIIDNKGREVGVLTSLEDFPEEELALVREEFSRRYLVPRIRRIVSSRRRHDLMQWTVETDRGLVTFMTRELREQVQEPLPRRLVITDVEGNRYEVVDLEMLDPISRRLLEEQL